MDSPKLKAKTRQQVAVEYSISERTLKRWLIRRNLEIPSGLIDPYHLEIIYHTFGLPES